MGFCVDYASYIAHLQGYIDNCKNGSPQPTFSLVKILPAADPLLHERNMTISVEQFIEQTPAKRGRRRSSKLWNYLQQVTALKQQGYSYDQIKDFLAKNDVEVKRSTLISFVRRAELEAEKRAQMSQSSDRPGSRGKAGPNRHSRPSK